MDNPLYYEDFAWAELQDEKIQEKANLFLSLIPRDVKTILDLGCGNGIITNILAEHFDVTGADRSVAALKMVKTKKVQCNCNDLPFADGAFDMVLSSEMLEHLEENVYQETIAEIRRVARKYILISVPDSEHIQRDLIKCTNCGYFYNMNYHQRSMNTNLLMNAFNGYKFIQERTGGPLVKPSFRWLTKLKHKLAPASSWIPTYWTKKRKRNTLCPKCDHSFIIPFRHHPVSFVYDVLTYLFSKARPYWLIVLFEKQNTGI
ncbi:MAG: class I SAM-dependent methyltransferase [Bacteroidales bacterium]|nr:class I SAM-dependent methyltransferase [Bacteroidales bacterium]